MQRDYVYDYVDWGGRQMVAVKITATGVVTLKSRRNALRLFRAGTASLVDSKGWDRLQAKKSSSLDPAFVRS